MSVASFPQWNLDELRVSKVAIYTANYTPTGPLSPNIGSLTPVYSDASVYNWPMVASGTASIETGNPKFGNGALQLDGATAVVTTAIIPGSPLDLSQTNFTFEFWAYPTADVLGLMIDASNADTKGFFIEYTAAGNVQASIWTGSSYTVLSGAAPLNTWSAIALMRLGPTFTLYIGGVAVATTSYAGTIGPMGGSLGIGGGFTTSFTGIIDEVRLTLEALYTVPYTPATAESTLGLPNVLGTATTPSAILSASYIGTVRATCDWASLDGQYWIAFATECKLYLVNNDTLYDITPLRQTSNATNVFSTVPLSQAVQVTDLNHRANQGDHMTILGPITVGGIVLNGDYDIQSVIDPNNYTITAATAATTLVNLGGGSVTLEYDISCGLATNGFLFGYGTGLYGEGTYGTPRPAGSGVPAKLRTWSLSNWGQDLVASYNNGELYWWQWGTGPNSRAQLVVNAPVDIQRLLVNADAEFAIAVGCSDISGAADPMNVRWCSQGDLTDWLPVDLPVQNTAGGQRLNFGSRMVAAIQSRQQNLLWSDTQMYQMPFQATSGDIFGFAELGKCFLVGPNAVIDVNGTAYMMCFDDFMIYDGTLRVLECDMWETVFGPADQPNPPTQGFDRSQAEMVYCASFMLKNEVTWFYPKFGTDVMQYVTYNYDLQVFYGGTMPRTCYHDVTPALAGFIEYPYAFNNGFLYQHEIGYDEGEGVVINPMYWFLQTWDIGAQSDRPQIIASIVPEFQRLRNGMQFSYLCKEYPQQTSYQKVGPFIVTPDCARVDERASGTQVALLFEAASVSGQIVYGQDFRMGVWQAQAIPHGKRMAAGSRGTPINTANP
jgi:hypothetical protein